MSNMIRSGQSIANAQPSKPTKKMSSLLEPNAKDGPESVSAENPLKQAIGGSGKPKAPFGKQGREF